MLATLIQVKKRESYDLELFQIFEAILKHFYNYISMRCWVMCTKKCHYPRKVEKMKKNFFSMILTVILCFFSGVFLFSKDSSNSFSGKDFSIIDCKHLSEKDIIFNEYSELPDYVNFPNVIKEDPYADVPTFYIAGGSEPDDYRYILRLTDPLSEDQELELFTKVPIYTGKHPDVPEDEVEMWRQFVYFTGLAVSEDHIYIGARTFLGGLDEDGPDGQYIVRYTKDGELDQVRINDNPAHQIRGLHYIEFKEDVTYYVDEDGGFVHEADLNEVDAVIEYQTNNALLASTSRAVFGINPEDITWDPEANGLYEKNFRPNFWTQTVRTHIRDMAYDHKSNDLFMFATAPSDEVSEEDMHGQWKEVYPEFPAFDSPGIVRQENYHPLIPPYNDPEVIGGQGSATEEIISLPMHEDRSSQIPAPWGGLDIITIDNDKRLMAITDYWNCTFFLYYLKYENEEFMEPVKIYERNYPDFESVSDPVFYTLSDGSLYILLTNSYQNKVEVYKVKTLYPSFKAEPLTGFAPLEVSFTDESEGNINTWKWDFGDGYTSNEQNPQHIYDTKGIYEVILTISGEFGKNSTKKTISVYELVEAIFSANPHQGRAPLEVEFTNRSTGSIDSWHWDFGDGNTSTEQNPVYTYDRGGNFTVSLTVSGDGGTDTEEKEIRVIESGFSAEPEEGIAPLIVVFTDDSRGDIDTWHWNFGDGNTSSEQEPVHEYESGGTYTVTLTVSGEAGETSAEKIIEVYDSAEAMFLAEPLQGIAPLEVEFTDQSTGDINSWQWDFDDGETSSVQEPTHMYMEPGVYTVTLTVKGDGGEDASTREITVYEPAQAGFSASPVEDHAPLEVLFTCESSGDIDSWQWNFGDGNSSSEEEPLHTYSEAGVYSVTLTVSGDGGEDTAAKEDYITAIGFSAGKGTPEEPYEVSTAGELNSVRYYKNSYFKQTAHIDLEEYSRGNGWEPIGTQDEPFKGNYDGKGYKIENLFIDAPERNNTGLFGYIGRGEVTDLGIEDASVAADENVGGLAGYNEGFISNVYVTGKISGNRDVGGLIGRNEDGTITESYTTTTTSGEEYVGGLVGYNSWDGAITKSYTTGRVTVEKYAGGLVGSHGGIIDECYAAGYVSGERYVGGLVGHTWGGSEVTDSYYDYEAVERSYPMAEYVGREAVKRSRDEGIPKTAEAMRRQDTYEGWDFKETWEIIEGKSYPYVRGLWVITAVDYESKIDDWEVPLLSKERSNMITLTLRNIGTETWEEGSIVRLGAIGNEDDLALPENYRIDIDHDVEPAQTHTFTIPVYPEEAGTFTTEWQMLKEGEFWFGEKFSKEVEVVKKTNVESDLWQLFK